jgi:hypothetical protein
LVAGANSSTTLTTALLQRHRLFSFVGGVLHPPVTKENQVCRGRMQYAPDILGQYGLMTRENHSGPPFGGLGARRAKGISMGIPVVAGANSSTTLTTALLQRHSELVSVWLAARTPSNGHPEGIRLVGGGNRKHINPSTHQPHP